LRSKGSAESLASRTNISGYAVPWTSAPVAKRDPWRGFLSTSSRDTWGGAHRTSLVCCMRRYFIAPLFHNGASRVHYEASCLGFRVEGLGITFGAWPRELVLASQRGRESKVAPIQDQTLRVNAIRHEPTRTSATMMRPSLSAIMRPSLYGTVFPASPTIPPWSSNTPSPNRCQPPTMQRLNEMLPRPVP
jgi:hypothetical protein